jgi:hypothetical protein
MDDVPIGLESPACERAVRSSRCSLRRGTYGVLTDRSHAVCDGCIRRDDGCSGTRKFAASTFVHAKWPWSKKARRTQAVSSASRMGLARTVPIPHHRKGLTPDLSRPDRPPNP